MTIIAKEDSRNVDWKTNNKGSSLLKKMGWTEGQGLGKRKQGTEHALRAVKRTEQLGIGASQHESSETQHHSSFSSVLSTLQRHHSTLSSNSSASSSEDESTNKKKKRSKKKQKKKPSLTLARNKVMAGHAQKMRQSKCLKSKSKQDMAAIFGTKVIKDEPTSTATRSDDRKKSSKRKSRDGDDDKTRKRKKKRSKKTT